MPMQSGAYGKRLAGYVGLSEAQTLVTTTLRKAQLAVTRLRCDMPDHGTTSQLPGESAFMVVLHLRDLPYHDVWLDGRPVPVQPHLRGDVGVVHLEQEPSARFTHPFDMLTFYVPQHALDEVAEDHNAPRIQSLAPPPGQTRADPVFMNAGCSLLPALERPQETSRLFVDHMAFALNTHLAQAYGGMRIMPAQVRGGLAPWQVRRTEEFLDAALGADVSLRQLAGECQLSLSHFTRAFKRTMGLPPHRWLLNRRIEKAQAMLLRSNLPLAEIALASGFSGQSHFTRVFSARVGATPGAWRRIRRG
jgi:AraC family transcriptional regulator